MLDRTQSADAQQSSAADRIAALVGAILAKRGIDRAVAPDEDLSAGGLSSLDTVNLMLAVEAEFGIKIPDGDMVPANFRTVTRIESLVARLGGPSLAA